MNSCQDIEISIEDRWVTHPNGRIYTRTWYPSDSAEPAGNSVPIVLLHDSLGSVALWREFPQRLCQQTGRPVVAYDRLGFGQSDARSGLPAIDFVTEESTDYFPTVLKQLQLDRFIALGHSVGGGMAVNCAANLSERCAGLITIAAQAFPEQQTLDGIREAKEYFQHPRTFARLEKHHGDKARWVLNAWTDTWLSPEFSHWSLDSILPQVCCPVLALHGDQDQYGSSIHPETISRLASGRSTMKLVPDSEHLPHQEQPQQVLDLITEFLTTID